MSAEKMREEFIGGLCEDGFAKSLAKLSKELLPNIRIPDSVSDQFIKGLVTLCATYHVAGYDVGAAQSAERVKELERQLELRDQEQDSLNSMQELRIAQLQAQVANIAQTIVKLSKLARHSDNCSWVMPLPTGTGCWGCDCGLDGLVLDGEPTDEALPPATTQTAEAYKRRVQAEALEKCAVLLDGDHRTLLPSTHECAEWLREQAAELLKEGE